MNHETYLERGKKCSWLGTSTSIMSRDTLVAFIGMLDELATDRERARRELQWRLDGLEK